jgi:hypothetical protein
MWECQVLITVERITIDFIEPCLKLWWDAFVDVDLTPVKGHTPFSWPRLIGGVVLALEYFA